MGVTAPSLLYPWHALALETLCSLVLSWTFLTDQDNLYAMAIACSLVAVSGAITTSRLTGFHRFVHFHRIFAVLKQFSDITFYEDCY